MKVRIGQLSTKKGFGARDGVDRAHIHALAVSMRSRGQIDPVTVRRQDKEVIDGNHRIAAGKQLGWKLIEANLVDLSDIECHHFGLVANQFNKPLSHLEIGRKVHMMLQQLPRGKGRQKLKVTLTKELGLSSVRHLEDCLASYRQLHPETLNTFSHAMQKGLLTVTNVQKIRALPLQTQLVIAERIREAKDQTAVDRLIDSRLAMQPEDRSEPNGHGAEPIPPQNPDLGKSVTVKESPEQFFSVLKFDCKGRVQDVSENKILIESEGSSVNLLTELEGELRVVHAKAKPRDLLTVSLLLETPAKKKAVVPAS